MRRFHPTHSQRLDWAILCVEATRGWRRWGWRVVKWWLELGL